jgi:hypothetical protein
MNGSQPLQCCRSRLLCTDPYAPSPTKS